MTAAKRAGGRGRKSRTVPSVNVSTKPAASSEAEALQTKDWICLVLDMVVSF